MMLFGLDRSLVLSLARAVAVPESRGGSSRPVPTAPTTLDGDDYGAGELFAAAAWSGIAEPGDSMAGLVVAVLGGARALTMLIDKAEPSRWLDELHSPDAADPSRGEVEAVSIETMTAALERWRPRVASRAVVASLQTAARFEARLLTPNHPLWPAGCRDLDLHAPHALWVRGSVRAVDHSGGSVAIVGSRDATNYGEHVAMELSAGVSDRGFSVVSGGAYGIDGMAHRAALVSGGTTVAFLAGGVDRLYPAAHHDLLLRIAARGALVSELPCGASPTKWRFLQRNRLIAALTRATVVVEAGHRSGSLNTAGHAAALGRPLGAVPGPVTSVTSAGCHRLLREYDATCVTSPAEVVELVLGPTADRPALFELPPGPAAIQLATDVAAPARSPRIGRSNLDAPRPTTSGATDDALTPTVEHRPPLETSSGDVAAPPADDGTAVRVLDALTRRSRRTPSDVAARAGLSVRAVEAALGILLLEGRVEETETGWRRARA
ncbi:DNA-processing protein DprA [Herbiconiux sp. CPCC 205716]|uniref:DNA-processing protein DprA n=1 Tax=Herbiconiux gentiana TaxID=2970912 RepID=A0ABT2GE36_9MICO|nr:DNA-processing protein DprA [Herbiconiux gentiana]MCS5714478.1 DNA-processing protein DprA [Herbiconiux gentiana]